MLQIVNTRDQDNTEQHIPFYTKERYWKNFRNRS